MRLIRQDTRRLYRIDQLLPPLQISASREPLDPTAVHYRAANGEQVQEIAGPALKRNRELAADAQRQAANAQYGEMAAAYLKLPRQWNEMADDLERGRSN